MTTRNHHRGRRDERGQLIVIMALALVALVGGVSLVIEGGNAYAQQRVVQNAADAVANAGATVLAERLGGTARSDADVLAKMTTLGDANQLDEFTAYYTTVDGSLLNPAGATVGAVGAAARVGDGVIPPTLAGRPHRGQREFPTTFARAIGFDQFTAGADATAVTGALAGGLFMPVVFPVSMQDCDGTGTWCPTWTRRGGSATRAPRRPITRSARSTSSPCARPAAARS